jgi:hypothetical protein
MSFLTNSDNIIDAVLTRKGRELLTKGQFNITKYAFSDDGINYNLYDETAGQDADADILSLPILEPSTNDNAALQSLLVTMPSGTQIVSWLQVNPTTATIVKDSSGASVVIFYISSMNTESSVNEEYVVTDLSNIETFNNNFSFSSFIPQGMNAKAYQISYKTAANVTETTIFTFKFQGVETGLLSDEITLTVGPWQGIDQEAKS